MNFKFQTCIVAIKTIIVKNADKEILNAVKYCPNWDLLTIWGGFNERKW